MNFKKNIFWIVAFAFGCSGSLLLALHFKEYTATILFMGGFFTDKICNAIEN